VTETSTRTVAKNSRVAIASEHRRRVAAIKMGKPIQSWWAINSRPEERSSSLPPMAFSGPGREASRRANWRVTRQESCMLVSRWRTLSCGCAAWMGLPTPSWAAPDRLWSKPEVSVNRWWTNENRHSSQPDADGCTLGRRNPQWRWLAVWA